MKTLFLNSLLIFVLLIAALGAGLGTPASSTEKPGGQSQAASGGQAAAPSQEGSAPAKAEDVDTLEHILAAVYDCISGPAGPRDWGRFRSLFYSGARLIPTRHQQGKLVAQMMSVDDYARGGQAYFDKEGFYEAAVANRVEQWDHIAHVWSTYESRHAKGEKPFARGINSFQFFHDGSRWWVVTIYWEGEEAGHPLPEKYLK
jgi:hypothetical protein